MSARVIVLLLALVVPFEAQSVVIAVTHTVDSVDAVPGDGFCADAMDRCTLRAAVMEANANGSDDTIDLPAGTYVLDIVGSGADLAGDLDISADLIVQGAGADVTIVDGGAIDRIFQSETGTTVAFTDLTLQNGNGFQGNAGAVWNSGTMTFERCLVHQNLARSNGGGIYSRGDTLTIVDSTIRDNTAERFTGGGIGMNGGLLVLESSTVSGNQVLGMTGDVGDGFGGGVATDTAAVITNSTISGNSALTGGGGLYLPFFTSLDLSNVTIVGNTAVEGEGGGLYAAQGGTNQLRNSVVSANLAPMGTAPDCFGEWASDGYNLISDLTSCTFTMGTGDQTAVDPLLAVLADNGGPTETHLPMESSPLIDMGNPGGCVDDMMLGLAFDQRGESRPSGVRCDIGAVEVVPEPGAAAVGAAASMALAVRARARRRSQRG